MKKYRKMTEEDKRIIRQLMDEVIQEGLDGIERATNKLYGIDKEKYDLGE